MVLSLPQLEASLFLTVDVSLEAVLIVVVLTNVVASVNLMKYFPRLRIVAVGEQ